MVVEGGFTWDKVFELKKKKKLERERERERERETAHNLLLLLPTLCSRSDPLRGSSTRTLIITVLTLHSGRGLIWHVSC